MGAGVGAGVEIGVGAAVGSGVGTGVVTRDEVGMIAAVGDASGLSVAMPPKTGGVGEAGFDRLLNATRAKRLTTMIAATRSGATSAAPLVPTPDGNRRAGRRRRPGQDRCPLQYGIGCQRRRPSWDVHGWSIETGRRSSHRSAHGEGQCIERGGTRDEWSQIGRRQRMQGDERIRGGGSAGAAGQPGPPDVDRPVIENDDLVR